MYSNHLRVDLFLDSKPKAADEAKTPPLPARNLRGRLAETGWFPRTLFKQKSAKFAVLRVRLRARGPLLCTAVPLLMGSEPGILAVPNNYSVLVTNSRIAGIQYFLSHASAQYSTHVD